MESIIAPHGSKRMESIMPPRGIGRSDADAQNLLNGNSSYGNRGWELYHPPWGYHMRIPHEVIIASIGNISYANGRWE